MARYKDMGEGQGIFLTVKLSEQIIPGTFEFALNYLINKIDLSKFDENYHNDETGAAAYPPEILLKGILYNYRHGIISSRKIEDAFKTNIITKALVCDAEPDHATIAAFISTNSKAMADVFVKIVLECGQLGLITGDMFAIDGCKLPSNASKEWSGTIEELKKKREGVKKLAEKIIEQHKKIDKAEMKKLNKTCREYVSKKEYQKRHIERIEKKLGKLEKFLEEAKPKPGVNGEEIQSNVTDNESAKIKGAHGYIQGYNGIAVADSANQVIIAAEAVGSGPEGDTLPGMLDKLKANMKGVTGKEEPLKDALFTGDTGFFSEANLQAAAERGVEVLIPDQQFRKRDPQFDVRKGHGKTRFTVEDFTYHEEDNTYRCPAGKSLKYKGQVKLNRSSGDKWQASYTDCRECAFRGKCIAMRNKENKKAFRTVYIADKNVEENLSEKMREKIDAPIYRQLYGRRMQIIEPCFSNITYNKGMDRFTLRGKKKVNIQWMLFCMVHNIGKCVRVLGRR